MHRQITEWGIWPLVVFRVFPILAEATVLLAGIYRMPWQLFWPAIAVSNLGIALAFVVLGSISSEFGWFSVALPLSMAIPVSLLLMWLTVWRRNKNEIQSD